MARILDPTLNEMRNIRSVEQRAQSSCCVPNKQEEQAWNVIIFICCLWKNLWIAGELSKIINIMSSSVG